MGLARPARRRVPVAVLSLAALLLACGPLACAGRLSAAHPVRPAASHAPVASGGTGGPAVPGVRSVRVSGNAALSPVRAPSAVRGDESAWWARDPGLAAQAMALLRRAGEDGLRASDYLDPALVAAFERALARPADPAAAAALAARLQPATLRFLSDLRRGRLPPSAWPAGYREAQVPAFDPSGLLADAVAAGDLDRAVRAARPPVPQYARLRAALAAHRALDDADGWEAPLPPARDASARWLAAVRPGMDWAGIARLRARLEALGDWPAGAAAQGRPEPPGARVGDTPGRVADARDPASVVASRGDGRTPSAARVDTSSGATARPLADRASADTGIGSSSAGLRARLPDSAGGRRYETDAVEAVRRFQRRHGLDPDGVIGPQTRAALEVPPSRRARQIELALERLRWTPLSGPGPRIVINVPEYVLRAYRDEGAPPVTGGAGAGESAPLEARLTLAHTMRVVVGRALDTRTPLLAATLGEIEFNPYWNVPDSIARAELVPALRERPERWQAQGYEFVTAQGRVVTGLEEAMLDAVLSGQARIRQRPGPRNALGAIKFTFPNAQQIYLHDTPATALFDRERRDYSHGCIRVEDPVALASFALAGLPEADPSRIRAAMASGERRTLRLARPVQVVITHLTAVARDDGVHFRPDVYGHDAALERALARRGR